jgi:hypothetical protein
LKPLLQRCHSGLPFPVVGRAHQQPDPPHALALLRARAANGQAAAAPPSRVINSRRFK